jgi:hypothetical protein
LGFGSNEGSECYGRVKTWLISLDKIHLYPQFISDCYDFNGKYPKRSNATWCICEELLDGIGCGLDVLQDNENFFDPETEDVLPCLICNTDSTLNTNLNYNS